MLYFKALIEYYKEETYKLRFSDEDIIELIIKRNIKRIVGIFSIFSIFVSLVSSIIISAQVGFVTLIVSSILIMLCACIGKKLSRFFYKNITEDMKQIMIKKELHRMENK